MTSKLHGRLQRRLEELTRSTEVGAGTGAPPGDAEETSISATGRPTPLVPLPARPDGPRDASEVSTVSGYYSVGPMLLPARSDVENRVDLDEHGTPTSLVIGHEGATMRLEVFAAPRTEGTWDDLCANIAASLATQGADVAIAAGGPFGPQVRAAVRTGPRAGVQVRVIGIDGPGWLLRATVQSPLSAPDPVEDAPTGDAVAEDPVAEDAVAEVPPAPDETVPLDDLVDAIRDVDGLPEGPLGEIVLDVIVRRGTDPRPVGQLLPLVVDPKLLGRPASLEDVADAVPSRFTDLPGLWS